MTQYELVDRLCAVNTLLTDIVREQAAIIQQNGIELMGDGDGLPGMIERAETENDALEVALRQRV